MRFERDFELVVEADESVVVTPPFNIKFKASKSIRGGLNKAQIILDGLSEPRRLALVKDAEANKSIRVALSLGYKGEMLSVFKGTVNIGLNRRKGPVIETVLDCLDGGVDFKYSFTNRVIDGIPASDEILKDMPNTENGKLTEQRKLLRPKVLVGNSAILLTEQLTDGETWYIDDEQLYIIKPNEVTSNFAPVVSAKTGLISTPEREASRVTFTMLMSPVVRIGGLASLVSTTAPHLDGVYKIETIDYSGEYMGSDWTMTCTGFLAEGVTVL